MLKRDDDHRPLPLRTEADHEKHERELVKLAESGRVSCPWCVLLNLQTRMLDVHHLLCDAHDELSVGAVLDALDQIDAAGDEITACMWANPEHYEDDEEAA